MYGWIWRRLPGNRAAKLLASTVLLIGMLALLFYVVFPFAGSRLPFDRTNVGPAPTSTSTPAR